MWLVTGGAGYIGAHVVRRLHSAGLAVAVLDDLSTGGRDRLPVGVPVVVAPVTDGPAVRAVLERHRVTGVIHLAGRKSPSESIRRPGWYDSENVGGLRSLLEAMAAAGVRRLVFASTAAVYGVPDVPLVGEDATTRPISPYGRTKLAGEHMIARATREQGLSAVVFRLFNVVGAGGPGLGDPHAVNLVPRVFDAIRHGRPVVVTGADFPTVDGTGVRDYVHVRDVATAHLAAVHRLLSNRSIGTVLNIGTGRGTSVLEVLARVAAVTGRPVGHRLAPRLAGDAPEVVADVTRAEQELGWKAQHDLTEMIDSAWRAHLAVTGRSASGADHGVADPADRG